MQGPSTQDRLEIYELYARYSWALDTGDTDGYVANRHLPSDTPKAVNHAALDRAHSFALELIRRLDADVGRKAKQ